MMAKLWRWLPLWGKAVLALAILAILGLVAYFIFKHIVLIAVLVVVGILILYELGWLTRRNRRKVSQIIQSGKRLGGTQSKEKAQNALQDDLQFRQKFPAQYRATDGHHVRSKSELVIDNWLYTYRNRICHIYESRVPVEEVLYCDFCIEQGDKKKVYIEYWGYESDAKYLARKRYKVEIYEKYGFQLIQLNNKEISTLDDVLPRKLRGFGIEIE
jgi:hypothetical protein